MTSLLTSARDLQAGAIAAGHAVTAGAGARILDMGGSAFDAAFCALLAACLAEPVFVSLGGGGFLTAKPARGRGFVLDFFTDLPARKRALQESGAQIVHADFGTVHQAFSIGAGTSAMPGMYAGLQGLLKLASGRVSFEKLFTTALEAASGLRLSAFQASLLKIITPILTATEESRALYAPEGALLEAGALFENKLLRSAFARAARQGEQGLKDMFCFEALLAQQADLGGHLTGEDLADYRAVWRAPVCLQVEGKAQVLSNSPPALGGVLALAMLKELLRAGDGLPQRGKAIARVDKAWRSGPADGASLARMFGLALEKSAAELEPVGAFKGTTHISVIDRHGNAAALTATNGEGNGLMAPGGGYMMNNMLGEADVNPAGPHGWRPRPKGRRRLASMMAPTIAEAADSGLLALGSGGSNRIRTVLFQVLANRLISGMPIEEAVCAPRLHGEEGKLDIEQTSAQPEAASLEELFAEVAHWQEQSLYFGGVHAVERTGKGRFKGCGDPRRDGAFVIVD